MTVPTFGNMVWACRILGIAPIVVSGILRHSKPSITMDIYGHLLFSAQDEAARIMDSLVTPIRIPTTEPMPAERTS